MRLDRQEGFDYVEKSFHQSVDCSTRIKVKHIRKWITVLEINWWNQWYTTENYSRKISVQYLPMRSYVDTDKLYHINCGLVNCFKFRYITARHNNRAFPVSLYYDEYSAMLLYRGQFYPQYSQQTSHSSPIEWGMGCLLQILIYVLSQFLWGYVHENVISDRIITAFDCTSK